jgi:hypothetical protein
MPALQGPGIPSYFYHLSNFAQNIILGLAFESTVKKNVPL